MYINGEMAIIIETDQKSATESVDAGHKEVIPKNSTLKFEVRDKLTNEIIFETEGSIDYFRQHPILYGQNTGHLSVHSLKLEVSWKDNE